MTPATPAGALLAGRAEAGNGSSDWAAATLATTQAATQAATLGAPLTEAQGGALAAVVLCCGALLLAPVTVCGNALLLNALYRFKRLRTPSNYLLGSLASSDLGVGVLLPLCAYLEVSAAGGEAAGSGAAGGERDAAAASLCALPHCLLTALCCASLLVMAAIAVDRFTSLAQPLRYNNLITHRSVERYIAGLWLYAGLVGTAPLAARVWGPGADSYPAGTPPPAPCSGAALLRPPGVAVFLLCAVYAPCMVLVVGCYSYVYLVARNHHRAIYSVEVSLRHGHDAPYASRYTSTLAITVGLFVCLWLPFQMVIVVDLVCGSHLASSLRALCLSLPMFASSALNPWVYGYRNGEVRAAVQRVLGEMLTKVGLSSPHLGCPHLVTTGADAELNSFASNVRLCTLSFTATHTLATATATPTATPTPTRCCTTASATLLHPDDALLVQSPQSPSGPDAASPPSPCSAKAAAAATSPPTPSSRTLRVPTTPGHAALSLPHAAASAGPASRTTVITLAQTVIELRVPVPVPNAASAAASLSKAHHV